MSNVHHAHGHDDHHGHGHHDDEIHAHGSLKDYTIGFILSVILTAIPFWLVMTHQVAPETTKFVILGFAAVQVVVHMVYFLHMNSKSENGWNMMAMILTVILLVIILVGSIWVMYHMNANMMPHISNDGGSVHGMHDMQ
ncbi:cytochrome o ubiquinol oxidase subunit IV [uncultured Massilia sp.]|uniref:cytochrome o ubiquinol oxidase subunit IV n=1 Tax=uncultured Massilia sp. TaxID=169973 RepID=UPI0025F959F1|nr:cytochrome o ubiquinol oxidase subunit IV [uncultured Massilia sp.]